MRSKTTWRVRTWIRTVAVAAWLALLAQQFSTLHFVGRGEMPETEARDGWVVLAAGVLAVVLLAFRPFISVDDARVTLQGPLRRAEFARDDVVAVAPTGWGLRFTLRDGSRRTTIVCQDTASFTEPRWFDVAEAVTGARPVMDASHEADD